MYFGQNQPIKVQIFGSWSARVKNRQISYINFELTNQVLFKFCIIRYTHDIQLLFNF